MRKLRADSASGDRPKLCRKELPRLLVVLCAFCSSGTLFARAPGLALEAAQIRKACEEPSRWPSRGQSLSHERFEFCLNLIDQFATDSLQIEALSRSQKQTILEHLEALLTDFRAHSSDLRNAYNDQSPPLLSISMSESVLLEHSLRRALSKIRALETWEAELTMKGGIIRWGERTTPTIGLRAFLSIDLGQNIDGFAELETMTVRREGTGTLTFPLESGDLWGLSQLWIRSERLQRAHFWLGVRPDENDPVAPRRWAFFSVGSRLNLGSAYRARLDLNLRHDRFAFWDVSQDLFKPGGVERNLSALELNALALDTANIQMSMLLRSAFHWYADRQGALRRLSLGRKADLVPFQNTAEPYRVLKADAILSIKPLDWFAIEPSASVFRNVQFSKGEVGHFFQVKSRIFDSSWALEERFQWAQIDCEAMPPVGLHHSLFPGTESHGGGITLQKALNASSQIEFDLFGQRVSRLNAGDQCSWAGHSSFEPHIFHMGVLMSWTTTFSPAN